MAYVVTENCIRCKFQDCVSVCPVDCFHEGPDMLVINPEECIHCNLCVPECPVEAIFSEYDLPEDQKPFLQYNQEKSQQWPNIKLKGRVPADAETYRHESQKRHLLHEPLTES